VKIVGFARADRECTCDITWFRVKLCPEMRWIELDWGDGETSSVLKEIGVPAGWREPILRDFAARECHMRQRLEDACSSQTRNP
jgi:hypothetical protein